MRGKLVESRNHSPLMSEIEDDAEEEDRSVKINLLIGRNAKNELNKLTYRQSKDER